MRFFCLIATEDRLWNMRKAFRVIGERYGNAIEGRCFSLWDVCQKPRRPETVNTPSYIFTEAPRFCRISEASGTG